MKKLTIILSVIGLLLMSMPMKASAAEMKEKYNSAVSGYGTVTIMETNGWDTKPNGDKYITQVYYVTSTKGGYVYLDLLEITKDSIPKYQNNKEIEKKEISSKIIKKPVNKIVEVRNKQTVTTRASSGPRVSYASGKWSYSEAELDLLCAITAQEASSSYNASLAVITTACNRAASSRWKYNGTDPLSQYKAPGQFCYSIDSHWVRRLNGNYPAHVKQAVIDALNGKRNHNYLSFRSAGCASGVNIGGNVYFNAM